MRHGVQIGGDELASRVLVDAELSVLDLVVVDLAVEPDDDRAHVLVVRQRVARLELDLLAGIGAAADPRDACTRPRVGRLRGRARESSD
jgi:hypothetical protein